MAPLIGRALSSDFLMQFEQAFFVFLNRRTYDHFHVPSQRAPFDQWLDKFVASFGEGAKPC
jgi:hypothetical protein